MASFKNAVAAELEHVASRLVELLEREVASIRHDHACTSKAEPLAMAMATAMQNAISIQPSEHHGDECASFCGTMHNFESEEMLSNSECATCDHEDLLDSGQDVVAPVEFRPSCATTIVHEDLAPDLDLAFGNGKKKFAIVKIDCAYCLRDSDFMLGFGSSDPYCICKLKGRTEREFRTETIDNSLNPVWNHIEAFEIDEDDDAAMFEFVVMDHDWGKKDDFLGSAEFPLSSCYPNGFHGCLGLDKDGEAQLQISIDFIDDDTEDIIDMMIQSRALWDIVESPSGRLSTVSCASDVTYYSRDFKVRVQDHVGGDGFMDQFVSKPNSCLKFSWDVLSLLCICYDVFTVPAIYAYDLKLTFGMLIASCFLTVYWTLDIFANFFIGYTVHGVVETRFRAVARRYIKGWFVIDFGVVSMDWVFIIISMGARSILSPGNKILKVGRAAKTVKLLSIMRAAKISIYVPDIFARHSQTVKIFVHLKIGLFYILFLTHCISCIWYVIGTADGEALTWVQQRDIQSETFAVRYTISFDWVVAQFTPSPTDTHPQNLRERIFKIFIDFCGLVTFSTFISSITSLMSQLKALNSHRTRTKSQLWQYFAQNKVPLHLSNRIVRALHARDIEQATVQACEADHNLLQGLPERLLQELRVEVRLPIIWSHPFFMYFHKCDAGCVYDTCHKYLRDWVVMGGDEIFLRGALAQHVTFVTKGCIEYCRHGASLKVQRGGWLSEASIWIDGWVHRGDAAAAKVGEVLRLDAVQFRVLLLARVSEPETYTSGSYIREYVRFFLAHGNDYDDRTETNQAGYSDIWGAVEDTRDHARMAFVKSGQFSRQGTGRRISDYLREEQVASASSSPSGFRRSSQSKTSASSAFSFTRQWS